MDSNFWTTVVKSLVAPLVGLAVWYVKKVLERRWAAEDRQLLPPPAPPAPADSAIPLSPSTGSGEIRLISHSQFFYWWPVWMLGFVFAFLTYWEDNRLAVVPGGTKVEATATAGQFLFTLPQSGETNTSLADAVARGKAGEDAFPSRVSGVRRFHGPLFLNVLVLVVVLTHFSFRGIWSFVLLLALVAVAVGLALVGGWDAVLSTLASLNIQLNATAYLYIATSLFALWLITVFVIDQQRYLIVTPNEIRMRTGYRPREVRFPTAGVVFEQAKDDQLLNHVLGFGSGDVIVRAPNGSEFYVPNVLFVGPRLHQLKQLLGPDRVA